MPSVASVRQVLSVQEPCTFTAHPSPLTGSSGAVAFTFPPLVFTVLNPSACQAQVPAVEVAVPIGQLATVMVPLCVVVGEQFAVRSCTVRSCCPVVSDTVPPLINTRMLAFAPAVETWLQISSVKFCGLDTGAKSCVRRMVNAEEA